MNRMCKLWILNQLAQEEEPYFLVESDSWLAL